MALSGINLAPAFAGQEAVWQRVRTGTETEGRRGLDLWNREPGEQLTPGARCRFTATWG